MVEERSSLRSELLFIQGSSAGQSTKTLKLFQNDVSKQVLLELLSYARKGKDVSNMHGTIMSIARLDAWVVTAVRCLVKKEARRIPTKRYGGTCKRQRHDKNNFLTFYCNRYIGWL